MERTFPFSYFVNGSGVRTTDNPGFVYHLTWRELVARLTTIEAKNDISQNPTLARLAQQGVREAKTALSLFSPYYMPSSDAGDEVRRSSELCKGAWALVFDIDKQPVSVAETICKDLDVKNLAYIVHTTPSYIGETGPYNCRITVPFSTFLPLDGKKQTLSKKRIRDLYAYFGVMDEKGKVPVVNGASMVDRSCANDISRWYFLPAKLAENAPLECFAFGPDEGRSFFNPLSVLLPVDEAGVDREDANTVSRAIVEPIKMRQYLAEYAQKKKTATPLCKAAENAAHGRPLAEPGQGRNDLTNQVVWILRKRFNATPETIWTALRPAIQAQQEATPDDPGPSEEKVLAQIKRADLLIGAEEVEKTLTQTEGIDHCIKRAFGGVGIDRDEPYSEEEKDAHAFPLHHNIISGGGFYHFRVLDRYSKPYSKDEAAVVVRDYFAPAGYETLSWQRVTDKGVRALPLAEIMQQFGVVANEVISTYNSFSFYDPERRGGTLYASSTWPSKLTAQFDDDIEKFLSLLFGDKLEVFKDWLYQFPRVGDWNNPILLIHPAAGVGKSLIANALARIWDDATPITADSALAEFNGNIRRCPLISLSDVQLKDPAKGLAKIKDMITQGEQEFQLKNKERARIAGYIRMIICYNESGMEHLFSGLDLTSPSERDAWNGRVVDVPVENDRRDKVIAWHASRTDDDNARANAVASHFLSIIEERNKRYRGQRVNPSLRFGIPGTGFSDRTIRRYLNPIKSVRSQVIGVIYRTIVEPKAALGSRATNAKQIQLDQGIAVNKAGDIAIKVAALTKTVINEFHKLPSGAVQSEINKLISEPRSEFRPRDKDGKQLNGFYAASYDDIAEWAREYEGGDFRLRAAIGRPLTEEENKRLEKEAAEDQKAMAEAKGAHVN